MTATATRTAEVIPVTPAAGALAAVQAAAGSLVVVLVPVVLTWVVTGGGDASWADVVRVAGALWLLAQHVPVALEPDGALGLTPLALAVAPLIACALAGVRLARTLDPRAERIAAGATRAAASPTPWTALAAMALTHGAIGAAVAAAASGPFGRPVLWQAAAWPALAGFAGGLWGSLAYTAGGLRAGLGAALDRLPWWIARYLAGAVRGLLALGSVALAVVLGAVVLGFGRVLDLYQVLGGGVLGAAMITVMQLAWLPNLVVWVAAALTGVPFAVGAGSEISLQSSTLGPLPAVPVLAALPDPGPMPRYALLALLVPVIAGTIAAERLLVEPPLADDGPLAGARGAAVDLFGLVLTSGLLAAGLAALATGAAGPGRLAVTGPVAWQAGAAYAAAVALGGSLTWIVRRAAPTAAEAWADYRRQV